MMLGRGRGRGGMGSSFGRGGPPHGDDPRAKDKAMRSIFVANVSFDTTEEQLGTVLREVGPIVSLKLIYDPGTGKPRGFGFCEYEDTETAMSAVRNLAGRELNGRPLRIDSASNAPNSGGSWMEGGGRGGIPPPQSQPQQPERPMYGGAVPPENAPEVITKAVASLPPEQMFELMKQMKWFIQQNPQEARQLLLHNPQLAYALLQAQVVMKIVDVEAAHNILHRTARGPSLASHSSPSASSEPPPPPPPPSHQQVRGPPVGGSGGGGGGAIDPKFGPPRGDQYQGQHPVHSGPPPSMQGREDRGRGVGPPPPPGGDFRARPSPHGGGATGPPGLFDRIPPGRASPPRESRSGSSPFSPRDHAPSQSQDQDKAALIMQVLSLTDEQIQMLPPDQRSSILKLKDQIARSR